MSEMFLPIGLGGVFFAVFLAVVTLQGAMAERRRAVELLQAQVGEVTTTNLREEELTHPFEQRILIPAVTAIGRGVRRITPQGMLDRISRKLVLAGSPEGWDAGKIAAFKFAGGLAFGGLGLVIAVAMQLSMMLAIFVVVFLGLFGFAAPGAWLGQKALNRQMQIRRALPDTMDLLTISVEAGLGFDAAMAHVRRNVPGPLSQELSRLLQEIQLGVTRQDAFRHLGERTDVEELRAFILAMIQADMFGISIAKVLRSQSKELRTKRRQLAEEKAMKVPVKLLFPLIFCILPSMFVVTLGPGIIRMVKQVFAGGIF